MSRTVTWIVLVSSLIGSAAVAVAGPAGETAAATESSAMAEASDRSGPIAYASPAAYRAATGMTLPPYGEAPMLAELVSQGVLEPVEQRLPQEPVVVQPVDQIGTYGGQLRQPGHRPIAFLGWKGRVQNLFRLSYQNGFAIEPNIALSYELSEDFTRLTVRLRPGMRWSDGEPFTAADLLFWFDSIIGNDELTPAKTEEPVTGRGADAGAQHRFEYGGVLVLPALSGDRGLLRRPEPATVRAAPLPGAVPRRSLGRRGCQGTVGRLRKLVSGLPIPL